MPTPEDPNNPTATEEEVPAVETPAVETPQETDITDTALRRLGFHLDDELPPDEEEQPEDAATTEEEGGEQPAAGEEPPAETPAEEPPAVEQPEVRRVVRRRAPEKQPTAAEIAAELAKALASKVEAPAAVAAPAKPVVTEDPDAHLPEFDREEIALARFAEEVMPEKYKGMDQKYRAYLQRRDAKIQEIIKEEGSFDPNSEEYQRFVRESRPAFSGTDRQKLIKEQVKRETLTEAERRIQEREAKLERKLRELELGPSIQQKVATIQDTVLDLEDEAVKQFKADPVKATTENPIEAPIIETTVKDVASMTREYLRVSQGLSDPDDKNPVHTALSSFISHQGKLLDAMPEDKRVRPDGRVLISREKMHQLVAVKSPDVARYCTFDDDMVVDMLREFGRQAIKTRLNQTRQQLEKAGFKRVAVTPAAASAQSAAPAGAAATAKPAPAAPVKPKVAAAPKANAPVSAPPPQKGSAKPVPSYLKSLGFKSDVD